MTEESKTGRRGAAPATEEFVPSEEQILRELKQREKRKQYMNTPKAQANRAKYMKDRYEKTKAIKGAIASLKESDPVKYDELMKQAQASVK